MQSTSPLSKQSPVTSAVILESIKSLDPSDSRKERFRWLRDQHQANPSAKLTAKEKFSFSEREVDFILGASCGLSNEDIAKVLHVASDSVKTYARGVVQKTGASGRTQAVSIGYIAGIIPIEFSAPDVSLHSSIGFRRLEVLQLIATGKSNLEIGNQLEIVEDTVKTHSKRLLQILGAANRAEAASIGFQRALLRPGLPGEDMVVQTIPLLPETRSQHKVQTEMPDGDTSKKGPGRQLLPRRKATASVLEQVDSAYLKQRARSGSAREAAVRMGFLPNNLETVQKRIARKYETSNVTRQVIKGFQRRDFDLEITPLGKNPSYEALAAMATVAFAASPQQGLDELGVDNDDFVELMKEAAADMDFPTDSIQELILSAYANKLLDPFLPPDDQMANRRAVESPEAETQAVNAPVLERTLSLA